MKVYKAPSRRAQSAQVLQSRLFHQRKIRPKKGRGSYDRKKG